MPPWLVPAEHVLQVSLRDAVHQHLSEHNNGAGERETPEPAGRRREGGGTVETWKRLTKSGRKGAQQPTRSPNLVLLASPTSKIPQKHRTKSVGLLVVFMVSTTTILSMRAVHAPLPFTPFAEMVCVRLPFSLLPRRSSRSLP